MALPDLINSLFEFSGGLFILNHCRVLYAHKKVAGVSVLSTVFFFTWGVWNCWYYPHLEQMLSFYGGLTISAANCLWVGMLIYYKYFYKEPA